MSVYVHACVHVCDACVCVHPSACTPLGPELVRGSCFPGGSLSERYLLVGGGPSRIQTSYVLGASVSSRVGLQINPSFLYTSAPLFLQTPSQKCEGTPCCSHPFFSKNLQVPFYLLSIPPPPLARSSPSWAAPFSSTPDSGFPAQP